MKKTRADAKLLNLPEEQQAQLVDWLLSGMRYVDAQRLVEKEFGVRAGLAAFSGFYAECCSAALLARRSQAVSTAEEVATAAGKEPGRFDAATIDALKQKAFELSISPQADPHQVKALMVLVLKARDQDLEERRVKVLEAKAAQAEAARQVAASNLSPEEQQAKMRAIFGMS